MKRICQSIAVAILLAATASAVAAGKEKNPVWRMSSGSSDGNKTYYTIWCTNKNIVSVIAEHDTQQYCALPKGGKRHCDKSWDLTKATVKACQSK